MERKKIKEVLKPWGKEIWFAVEPEYVGKILHIKKGHRYSLQYHEKKKETQYVLKGKVRFFLGENADILVEHMLNPGDKLDVYPLMIHRAEAVEDSEILEISTNDLEDVVKLEDDYGRSGRGNDFKKDAKLHNNPSH